MHKRMLALKALRPHLYGTRRLEAGDEYEAPAEEALAHVLNRRADFIKGRKPTFAPATPPVQATPPPVVAPPSVPRYEHEPEPEPTIDDLRVQATQLGIDVDRRWGVHRLQTEIDEAKSR